MTREEASYILRKFYADGYKSNNYNTLEQALKIAVICIENLPHWISVEFPHWISVEDELPPKKSEYEDLSNDVLATDGKKIYKSFYDYGFEEWFTREIWRIDNITHWMPLPSIEHLKD